MSSTKRCRHITLAKNHVAHIEQCAECACISMHVGPLTVRLEPKAMEELLSALAEATKKTHLLSYTQAFTEIGKGVA
jgi:hypothetical protein